MSDFKTVFFIFVMMLSFQYDAFTQNVGLRAPLTYRNSLKFTPAKLIALVNPAVEFSYERRTSQRFSTELMGSYLLPATLLDIENDYHPQIRGFRVALEEKYHFSRANGLYAALEANYLKNSYQDIVTLETPDSKTYPDSVSLKKQTFSINTKMGFQKELRRIIFDFYGGIGWRYKDTKHFNRINPDDAMDIPIHPSLPYFVNMPGKRSVLSLTLNARIGWRF